MGCFMHFFIVGVLIGGAACGDVICFINKLKDPSLLPKITDVEGLCSSYSSVFENTRKEIKNCKVEKINVDGLESFVKEICDPGSTFVQDFKESQPCIMSKLVTLSCGPKLSGEVSMENIREECKNRGSMMSCVNDGLGKPCGEKALRIMQKFTKALESFYEGWCAEAGGAAANAAFWWTLLFGVFFSMMKWQSV